MLRSGSNLASSQTTFVNEDKDEASDDDEAPIDFEVIERCPIILLSKEEEQRMRKPWKDNLIINMFDGKLG